MKFFFILLFLTQFCFAQEIDDANPCDDPILLHVKSNGVKSVPLIDLVHYYQVKKACEKSGGEEFIQQIERDDLDRDFNKSKTMISFTSTYSILVVAIIGYFYFGKLFAPPTS